MSDDEKKNVRETSTEKIKYEKDGTASHVNDESHDERIVHNERDRISFKKFAADVKRRVGVEADEDTQALGTSRYDRTGTVGIDPAVPYGGQSGTAPQNIADSVNELFGGAYEVSSRVGGNGQSSIYLLHSTDDVRTPFILKVVKDIPGDNVDALDGARALSGELSSVPYLADFVAAKHSGDEYFIVRKYIDGRPMTEWTLAEGGHTASPDDVERWMKQIGSALLAMHDKGILHCDIKPSNIIITSDSDAYLIDFDLAYDMNKKTGPLQYQSKTYVSPQVIQGKEPDIYSDMYSFGAAFYQVITKKAPAYLNGLSSSEMKNAEAAMQNDLIDRDDYYPASAIISRCLSYYPDDRYESFANVVSAIEKVNDNWKADSSAVSENNADSAGGRRRTQHGSTVQNYTGGSGIDDSHAEPLKQRIAKGFKSNIGELQSRESVIVRRALILLAVIVFSIMTAVALTPDEATGNGILPQRKISLVSIYPHLSKDACVVGADGGHYIYDFRKNLRNDVYKPVNMSDDDWNTVVNSVVYTINGANDGNYQNGDKIEILCSLPQTDAVKAIEKKYHVNFVVNNFKVRINGYKRYYVNGAEVKRFAPDLLKAMMRKTDDDVTDMYVEYFGRDNIFTTNYHMYFAKSIDSKNSAKTYVIVLVYKRATVESASDECFYECFRGPLKRDTTPKEIENSAQNKAEAYTNHQDDFSIDDVLNYFKNEAFKAPYDVQEIDISDLDWQN